MITLPIDKKDHNAFLDDILDNLDEGRTIRTASLQKALNKRRLRRALEELKGTL